MHDLIHDIDKIIEQLENVSTPEKDASHFHGINAVIDAAREVGKSFSNSWFGYHSRVYYQDFSEPPAGAHFSMEWGIHPDRFLTNQTRGKWKKFTSEQVRQHIQIRADTPDLSEISKLSADATDIFEDQKSQFESVLAALSEKRKDSYINRSESELSKLKILSYPNFVDYFKPTGLIGSRDAAATDHGIQTPPHIVELSSALALRQPFESCDQLKDLTKRLKIHLARVTRYNKTNMNTGKNVFIGHGGSPVWKDLKEFLTDRLNLPWDEFNRVAIAGIPNTSRLEEMLDAAGVAFLILTAEDELQDGSMQARLNVVHEAGLFQGRLGFQKAIILLEDGCEEFSNIHGLGQIRFPAGNISARFEEIRRVLEREGFV